MIQRHGAIYNNLRCPSCGSLEDSYTHMWTCPGNQETIDEIVEDISSATYDAFKDDFNVISRRVTVPELTDFFRPSQPDFLPNLARGFTTATFEESIGKLLFAKVKAKKLIKFFSD